MSERAVEKHVGSVFQKLGLVDGVRREPPGDGGPRLSRGHRRPGGDRAAATHVTARRAASTH